MLDAYVIEELQKKVPYRENMIQLPIPEYEPVPKKEEKPEGSRVIIIQVIPLT